jgi:hypothetical protein
MKNKKYQCKIEYENIVSHKNADLYYYTNQISDLIEYARQIRDNTTYLQRMDIIDNRTGELLIVIAYHKNYYYIDSSAHKLASKILRKV